MKQNKLKLFFIFLTSILIMASSISAGTFDPSSISGKELKKAERYSKQYDKKVSLAESLIQKKKISTAEKRLKSAEKIYNRINEAYKAHPFVLKTKKRFDLLKKEVVKALGVKNLEKNAKNFARKVKEAKKYLARRDKKNCRRFLDKAISIYSLIPDEAKNRRDIAAKKKEYDETLAKLENTGKKTEKKPVKDENTYGLDKKALRNAKKYAARYIKKVDEAKRFFDENKYYICEKRLGNAEYLYSKINPEYRANLNVEESRKSYESMLAIVSKTIKDHKEAVKKKNDLFMAGVGFNSDVRSISTLLNFLMKGKNNDQGVSLWDVEKLKENYKSLESFYSDCTGKYKSVVETESKDKYEGLHASEIFDLVKNRDKYRDIMLRNAENKDLGRIIKGLETINSGILNKSTAVDDDITFLNKKDFLTNYPSVKKTEELCSWAGIERPSKLIQKINSFQKIHRDSIREVRKKLKFKKSDYDYNTSAMKSAAKTNAASRNMKLIYVGMKDNKWTIVKNGLGIPLYKEGYGRGLYHVDGEDFYRGYDVTIKKQFNGNGYEPVSSVKAGYRFTIYKK